MELKDINGVVINVGDTVYYARKSPSSAKGLLTSCVVTKIENDKGNIKLKNTKTITKNSGTFTSTSPHNQIVIDISIREKKLQRILNT